jgi:hypothetical protein
MEKASKALRRYDLIIHFYFKAEVGTLLKFMVILKGGWKIHQVWLYLIRLCINRILDEYHPIYLRNERLALLSSRESHMLTCTSSEMNFEDFVYSHFRTLFSR